MAAPRFSFQAINALASGDTGHFVYLDAWSISLLDSMLSQERPLYLWMNDQNPLSESEIDELDNRLSTAQEQLMRSLVGLIMPICTQGLPQGVLLCDGSTHARADYPGLYEALDAVFHVDADNFVTPDLRDKFILAAGDHAPYTTGGSFDHTQTIDEMPSHSHTSPPHSHTESAAAPTSVTIGLEVPVPAAVPAASVTGATAVSIDSTGGGAPMDITPPFYALRYVVVAL